MKWLILPLLMIAGSASAQTTLFPSNGMARWCWNGTMWFGCTATASGNPTDKFPVNGRASWCWNGSAWVGCPQ